jgi:hypothetical protein
MGLDMYLNAERYLWGHEEGDKQISENIGQLIGLPTDGKVKTITVEAGYWRKSNQIHNWFVANVQEGKDECQDSYVSREQLKELREVCQKVLDNNELAEQLLPTASGFFFGGTEYDQWYFNDIEETIKIIDNALLMPKQWDFNYRSSW